MQYLYSRGTLYRLHMNQLQDTTLVCIVMNVVDLNLNNHTMYIREVLNLFIFSDKTKTIINAIFKTIMFFVCCSILIGGGYVIGYKDGVKYGKKQTTTISTPTKEPTITTTISATKKNNNNEPDLILNNHYKATIDGTTIDIPTKPNKIKEPLESSPPSTTATDVTARVDQTLDLTPLFKDYEKKKGWEAGIGVGVVDNKYYVPVELQRNFGYNKAVSMQLNVSDRKIEGCQVAYKIRF